MRRFHDLGICQLYYVGGLNRVRIFVYYSYIQVDTWKFGGSYIPDTIHMIHCSSQHYSHETLFHHGISLKILFMVVPSLKILTLFIMEIFLIDVDINFCLFPNFLAKNVR